MILPIYFLYIKIQESGIMSKKRRKKTITTLTKTVEIKDIPNPDYELKSQEEQHFELLPFPLISLCEDYNAYRIMIEGEKTTVGYFGLFIKSGKFNYVILGKKSEVNETYLLLFLKNFIKELGLIPVLNPHILKYF